MFYPDIKKHLSPSALASWINSPASFTKSYFAGEKTPETLSMKAGKVIHKLVEEGFITVNCRYEHNEGELVIPFDIRNDVDILGRPDSYGGYDERLSTAYFVDYKSVKIIQKDKEITVIKESDWDNSKLASDIKMKLTAWLVWKKLNEPKNVFGYIEYIPTEWDNEIKNIKPTGEQPKVLAGYCYTSSELKEFTNVIEKAINDINNAYEIWLTSSDTFIDQKDITAYAEIEKKIKDLETEQAPIKERIFNQMSMGNLKSYKMEDVGSFSITTRKTFSYPEDLPFQVGEKIFTLKDGEKIADAMKACRDNYELTATPVSTSQSLGFKAKKSK